MYVKENIIKNLGDMQTNTRKRLRTETDNITQNEDESDEPSDRELIKRNNRILESINQKLLKTDDDVKMIDSRVGTIYNDQTILNARMLERIDGIENRTRRNLLVLRGLKIDNNVNLPTQMKEKANYIHALLTQDLAKLPIVTKNSVGIKSLFLIPNGGSQNTIQDIRLTCQTIEDGQEIKMRILKAKDMDAKWKDIEVSNDPVKATRVRICLLQAICRQINNEGSQEASVSRYADSPTLMIRSANRLIKNLSFVDAVLQYGSKISQEDLEKATKIAGTSFPGQLEATFLIIKDPKQQTVIPTPSGVYIQPTRGTYRGRGRGRGRGGSWGVNRFRWTNPSNPNLIPITQGQTQQKTFNGRGSWQDQQMQLQNTMLNTENREGLVQNGATNQLYSQVLAGNLQNGMQHPQQQAQSQVQQQLVQRHLVQHQNQQQPLQLQLQQNHPEMANTQTIIGGMQLQNGQNLNINYQ